MQLSYQLLKTVYSQTFQKTFLPFNSRILPGQTHDGEKISHLFVFHMFAWEIILNL